MSTEITGKQEIIEMGIREICLVIFCLIIAYVVSSSILGIMWIDRIRKGRR